MSSRTFVIGDVHGCALTLQQLIFKVIKLRQRDRLYFLGDLIDRGPRSREVLDLIIRLQSAGYYIRSIRGNHEEMLLDACANRNTLLTWLVNGGQQTLQSFSVESPSDIPLSYRTFISDLPYFIQFDRFILCHAGINCDVADPLADTTAMLWSRDLTVLPEKVGNRKVICGHTVHTLAEITNSLGTEKISLDGGCVYAEKATLGNLIALETGSMTIHYAANIDCITVKS